MPIPYEDGWQVLLNGEPAELYRANIGFMAVALEPGEYTVEAQFTPPGLKTGVILSLVGTGLLVIMILLILKYKLPITF